MMRYVVALVFFLFVQLSVSLTLNKETCEAISLAKFHGSSCFIMSTVTKTHADANKLCNHFGNGHLVYPTTEKTMEVIKDLTLDPAYPTAQASIRIGLTQVDPSVEPDGGWAWYHPDGRTWNITDVRLLLWGSSQPNNYYNDQHDGFYDKGTHRLNDDGGGGANIFVCEYEATQKHFKSSGKDQMGHHATHISQSYENNLRVCAIQCHKELLCRGYSYKQTDGHCILHFTTSDGVPALPPVAASGYKMFDTYY